MKKDHVKTIICDVDGVLADFVLGFTGILHKMGAVPGAYTTSEQQVWDFELEKGVVSAAWEKIRKGLPFWTELKPLLSFVEAERLRKLAEYSHVYFVTSRFLPTGAKSETEDWLRDKLGIRKPTVIISANKGEMARVLNADFAIDDKAGNAVFTAYASRETESFLLDRPYNRFTPGALGTKVNRVKTFTEFLDQVNSTGELL